jgi:tryptophan synthase alpha chain
MAFMPFITAGDPSLDATADLIRALAETGVDLIEVGFPYSDPIADGPVIQASYTRALARGCTAERLFATVGRLTAEAGGDKLPPLVAMCAMAIVHRLGAERFLRQACAAGFSGLIVPDLPGDAPGDLARQAAAEGIDLIPLVAPTTSRERARRILANAQGFLYCISSAGTTGVRDALPPELRAQLSWLRTETPLPLAVGFGISRPEQIVELRGLADGAIVGSALVRLLESAADREWSAVLGEVRRLSERLCASAHAV